MIPAGGGNQVFRLLPADGLSGLRLALGWFVANFRALRVPMNRSFLSGAVAHGRNDPIWSVSAAVTAHEYLAGEYRNDGFERAAGAAL